LASLSLKERYERASLVATRHEAIAAAIDEAIADGALPAGARLPTVRALSRELNVSASTVVAAYNALRFKGLINGEVGRGTYVTGRSANGAESESGSPARSGWGISPPHHRPPWRRRNVLASANRLLAAYPNALDCTRGKPDTSLILTDIVRAATKAAASEVVADDLQYAGPAPIPVLREAVAPRLARDGITVQEMVVGNSAQQLMVMALSIASRLMPDRQRIVAVEEPGYQTVFDAFEYLGFRLVGMALDEHGVLPHSLERALDAGAIAALFTPRALNPCGVSWTAERKLALAEVLQRHQHVLAIEDDQFADLALTHPGSLLDTAVGDRTVYIRTFAKSIAPDMRVALGLARPRLANALGEAKSLLDGWTSHHSQRVLAGALVDDRLDDALHVARESYRIRRDTIVTTMRSELASSGAQVSGSDGLNVWISLPYGVAATEVVERAAALGVLLISGEPFYIRPGHNNALRMSVSGISNEQATLAAQLTAEAVRLSNGPSSYAIPL
jgi:GntR family transcriptional regulator/MocR family aminotransferase